MTVPLPPGQQLTVTVTDSSGTVLYNQMVDTAFCGSNADDANLTHVEKALLIAAPEVCPWDCDNCRG